MIKYFPVCLLLSGCSFAMTEPRYSSNEKNEATLNNCTTSNVSPVLDTIGSVGFLTAAGMGVAEYYRVDLSETESMERDEELKLAGAIGALGVTGIIYGVAAFSGFSNVSECRAAIDNTNSIKRKARLLEEARLRDEKRLEAEKENVLKERVANQNKEIEELNNKQREFENRIAGLQNIVAEKDKPKPKSTTTICLGIDATEFFKENNSNYRIVDSLEYAADSWNKASELTINWVRGTGNSICEYSKNITVIFPDTNDWNKWSHDFKLEKSVLGVAYPLKGNKSLVLIKPEAVTKHGFRGLSLVLIHEIGHALGIQHTEDPRDVMHQSIDTDFINKTNISGFIRIGKESLNQVQNIFGSAGQEVGF